MLSVSTKTLFILFVSLFILSNCSILINNYTFENLFEQWLQKYLRDYVNDPLEKQQRLEIFTQNVISLNNQDLTVNGLNKFSDMTDDQFSNMLGRLQSQSTTTLPPKRQSVLRGESGYPRTFDWRDYNVITSVKDQGNCGNCWSFSTAAFFQSQLIRRKQASKDIDLAEQFFFQCDSQSQGCSGGYLDTAIDLGLQNGIPYQAQFPWNSNAKYNGVCSASVKANIQTCKRISIITGLNDQTIVKYLLQRPLNIGVSAKEWKNYAPTSSRTFLCSASKSNYDAIDHTVLLVGFTESEWIVKNQWGLDWGVSGYIYISRDSHFNCGVGWQIHTLDFKLDNILETIKVSTTLSTQNTSSNGSSTNTTLDIPANSNPTNIRVEIPLALNCTLDDCQTCYYNSGSCVTCKVGYQLNTNTKGCELQKIPNCLQFTSWAGYYQCLECKPDFNLIQGSCAVPGKNPPVIDANIVTIVDPISNIPTVTPPTCNIPQCASCYNNNGKTQCFTCIDGYATNQRSGLCQTINIDNCNLFVEINTGLNQCYDCKKGFTFTNLNTCVSK